MMISGTNYLGEKIISNKYIYSEHFLIWGGQHGKGMGFI